jgi:hypothetical protein
MTIAISAEAPQLRCRQELAVPPDKTEPAKIFRSFGPTATSTVDLYNSASDRTGCKNVQKVHTRENWHCVLHGHFHALSLLTDSPPTIALFRTIKRRRRGSDAKRPIYIGRPLASSAADPAGSTTREGIFGAGTGKAAGTLRGQSARAL